MTVSGISTIVLCAGLVLMIAFLGWTDWKYQQFPSVQIERLTKQAQTVREMLHGDPGEEADRLYALQNEITLLKYSYEQDEPVSVSEQLAYESLLYDLAEAGISVDRTRTKEEICLEIERLEQMKRRQIKTVASPYALNAVNLAVLFFKNGFAYGLLIVYVICCAYVFGWEMDASSYIPLFTGGAGRQTIVLAKLTTCLKVLGSGIALLGLFFGAMAILLPLGNMNMPVVFDGKVWTSIRLIGQLALNTVLVFLFLTAVEMVLTVRFLKQEMIVLGTLAMVLIGVFVSVPYVPIRLVQTNDIVSMLIKGALSVMLIWLAWVRIKRKDLII